MTVLTERLRSTLYLAQEDGRTVVLKVLNEDAPSRSELGRFATELSITQHLDIPGIRRAIRLDDHEGRPALVMGHVSGETVRQLTGDGMPLDRFLPIAIQLANTLGQIHARRIIHRDLSPANLLISPDGRATIIDFGLAARLDTKVHHLGNPDLLRGTLAYISPEQTGRMNRFVDHRTDLYSLGAVFYEMLTGAPPFTEDRAIDVVHAHLARLPQPPQEHRPEIGAPLSDIILRLLAKHADDRYQSAQGLAHDLQRCQEQLHAGAFEPFALAQRDVSDRLRLPQALYGREAQDAVLRASFAKSVGGEAQLLLVRGAAGSGKTALVHEVHRAIGESRGWFIDGKFDQLQRVPYQAFIGALQHFADLLLVEPADSLARWRERISGAVGELGGVLTTLSPRLAQVLGEQPPLPSLLGASEEQNRFFYIMRRFLAAVARAEHPLVVFLDDLQWADPSSIALVRNLLTSPEGNHLLLIGAYRDSEVSSNHPLILAVDELKRAGAGVAEVEVGDLSREDLGRFVADTLRTTSDACADLADLVFAKTHGNPFFARRFLVTLQQEGAVQFDHDRAAWTWDLVRAEDLALTDNVVEFMAARAARLSPATTEVLKSAACIGNQFDTQTLAVVADTPADAVAAALWPALEDGLVVPLSDGLTDEEDPGAPERYRFAHDRIQQAVYSLIDPADRARVHERIGTLLLDATPEDRRGERLFDIVNQLDLAIERIDAPERRVELACLNLRAGKKAMGSAAYGPALVYLGHAAALLPERAWETHYGLWLDLNTTRCEAALLAGPDSEVVNQTAREVIAHARTAQEKMPAYDILLQLALLSQEVQRAQEVGLEALTEFGVRFPARPNVGHILIALARCRFSLIGRTPESLIDLPPLTNPEIAAILPMIERICPAAFRVGTQLFPLLTLRLLELTLKHGNAGTSTFAYAGYGITMCGVLGDIDTGYRFGKLALDLTDRLQANSWRAKTEFIWANFICHWREPLGNAVDSMRRCYLVGLETGSMYEAVWAAFYEICWRYHIDGVLPDIDRKLTEGRQLLSWDDSVAANARLLHQVVDGLMRTDGDEPWTISGRYFDAATETEAMRAGRDMTGLCSFHCYSVQLATLFDRHDEALAHIGKAAAISDAIASMPMVSLFELHASLARLAAHRAGVGSGHLSKVRASIRTFRKWARFCPSTQTHRLALIEAELARTTGRDGEAGPLYDRAIEAAADAGILQEEARALELAADYYFDLERGALALFYMQRALAAYERWGARAKVRQLRQNYPALSRMNRLISSTHAAATSPTSPSGLTTSRSGEALDLQSIADAANAISGEMVLENLVEKLLNIAMSNAGAERGALLIVREGQLTVAAEARHGEGLTPTPEPAPTEGRMPMGLIHYCQRTHEVVVLDHAARTGMFRDDPYVRATKLKSVLCVPLVRSKELVGLIYLENNLASDAFTADRGRSVRLLAGQAATSIRNAQLYGQLQGALDAQVALNHATARFVPHEFLQSLNRSNLQEVELGDSAAKVMSVFFSDIRSFTSLVETHETSDALLAFINEYLSHAEPHLLDAGGFIDSYNGDGVMALFDDADRAVQGAVGMQRGLALYNTQRVNRGELPLVTGIGISTGQVMMGTIGGPRRMKCGVIGDPVNTASRVEGLTKEYRANVMITDHTVARLRKPERLHLRRADRIRVVGKNKPITVYQVLDAEDPRTFEAIRSYQAEFDAAQEAYYRRDFKQALSKLYACLSIHSDDHIAGIYAERCRELIAHDPPPGWDGVINMSHK